MNRPPVTVTPVFVADLLAALDPQAVWLSHTYEPWRPPTG